MLTVTMMTSSSVLCTIKTWLWSCWWLCCTLLFLQFFDIGALSWVSVKTLERAPTAVFGRLVKCSTHGYSSRDYSYLLWRVVGSETLGLPYLSSGWCHVQRTGIVQSQWAKVGRNIVMLFSTNYQRNKTSFHFTWISTCTQTTMTYLHCSPFISQCSTSICQSSVIPAYVRGQILMIFIESCANQGGCG